MIGRPSAAAMSIKLLGDAKNEGREHSASPLKPRKAQLLVWQKLGGQDSAHHPKTPLAPFAAFLAILWPRKLSFCFCCLILKSLGIIAFMNWIYGETKLYGTGNDRGSVESKEYYTIEKQGEGRDRNRDVFQRISQWIVYPPRKFS
jgi:hypothetical protein